MATVHDHRIMREDRGWFCINEVHIDIGKFKLMHMTVFGKILRSRLSPATFHDVLILGKRYTGPEAQQAALVHSVTSSDHLLSHALAAAKGFKSIPRDNLRTFKEQNYGEFLLARDEDAKLVARL